MNLEVSHQPSGGPTWTAKITGLSNQYGFEREFLRYIDCKRSSSGKTGSNTYQLNENQIYEINENWKGRYFIIVTNGESKQLERQEVIKIFESVEQIKKEKVE